MIDSWHLSTYMLVWILVCKAKNKCSLLLKNVKILTIWVRLSFFLEGQTIWCYIIILCDEFISTILTLRKNIKVSTVILAYLSSLVAALIKLPSMNLGKTYFMCRNLCHLQALQQSQKQQEAQQIAAVALCMCGTV